MELYVNYYEGTSRNQNWTIRLSRQYCGTRMYIWREVTQPVHVPFPGGCSTSDYTFGFTGYVAGECYNEGGPRMWVNCRVALL
jgi:hypothetical protein